MNIISRFELKIGQLLSWLGFGMRAKLITIFLVIKVIPLILLTIIAWGQARHLGDEINRRTGELTARANEALATTGALAVSDSVNALNDLAIEQLERASTDLAKAVAEFLYERDSDILYLAGLEPTEANLRRFLDYNRRAVVKKREWVLSEDRSHWVPKEDLPQGLLSPSSNSENDSGYHNRPADPFEREDKPLYLEATYLDLAGNEIVKETSSGLMDGRRKNVSFRSNTYAGAETYFAELKNLRAGDIYVSDVIGPYVGSHLIGMYNPENVEKRGLEWQPEAEAYAGRENPNGRRFRGIIRWASPVVRNGRIAGYVTLALDHDHIMEFTDHITPMEERYVEIPSAFEGNYAFIWDYKCRSISHPRHHSIVGYNPETGEEEIPWLEESIYKGWQESGRPLWDYLKGVPVFDRQSREKKPAPELTARGLVGLDGRYLNNAPQCTGWFDLTAEGGSGSFLILWSGIWKPNTAAAIPYYTGNYGKTRRGFGFVAIGAGLEDFQQPARETEAALGEIIAAANNDLTEAVMGTNLLIQGNLRDTSLKLFLSAALMIILVVLIAIWMASVFTNSITNLISGITRFRSGERQFRFRAPVKDEIGTLSDSFDEMADSLVDADRGPLVIAGIDGKIKYLNAAGLAAIGVDSLEDCIGKNYGDISVYPAGSPSDPVEALIQGREAEIYHEEETGHYYRGNASYLTDRQGQNIGYIITTQDITGIIEEQEELRHTKEELEVAVDDANRANAHKGEFLARMSHEIRTPMNAIIGMTNIVKKKLANPGRDMEEIQANINQIETSSQHLLGLLNDILDISKIEAGKIELSDEEIDLLKLAETVAVIIKPRCDEKGISFHTRFDLPADKSYRGDTLRLRQVLINLLGNAVKFTHEMGEVFFDVIRRESRGDKAVIDFAVRDTGIGISPEGVASLFKPFEQTSNNITKKYGGTGLGLAISRSIVQLFGGDITVKSELGKGSEFSFTLELEETDAGQKEEYAVEDAEGKLKNKRALLVDDVDINRVIAANMLEFTGIDIVEAADGLEAVKLFSESAEGNFDIVYMDVQMPNLDGYGATIAIRALDREDAKTVPIVALTANAFKDDTDRSMASGMNAHLAKPLDMEKLIEVTLKLLSGKG
ncbi:hypothetical protein AGMMS49928_22830 [Spirochaetia bacterium]|nr:hypothetical protein AGMMS49928_22830 [Spirochaetia bacterium]